MKIYHLCQCCDQVYKITTAPEYPEPQEGQLLTGVTGEGIINPESGSGISYHSGLCEECREEIYGTQDWLILPHRLH